jgi:hypothetical protein
MLVARGGYRRSRVCAREGSARVYSPPWVRGGGEFDALQDSWPAEIVSVEALPVEPYATRVAAGDVCGR